MLKTVKKEMYFYIHPRSIRKIKFNQHVVEHEVIRSINIFLITYMMILAFSTLLIALDGFDLITDFTAVAATLNNIDRDWSWWDQPAISECSLIFQKWF